MSSLSISNFIWGIADDVLRDHDAMLEPTKEDVLGMKARLDGAGIANQDQALRQAAGEAFYNTSPFRLRDLQAIGKQQQLRANFEAYLDGNQGWRNSGRRAADK